MLNNVWLQENCNRLVQMLSLDRSPAQKFQSTSHISLLTLSMRKTREKKKSTAACTQSRVEENWVCTKLKHCFKKHKATKNALWFMVDTGALRGLVSSSKLLPPKKGRRLGVAGEALWQVCAHANFGDVWEVDRKRQHTRALASKVIDFPRLLHLAAASYQSFYSGYHVYVFKITTNSFRS